MNLNQVAINIRPRSQWQAVDMGMVLARKWFWNLLVLWYISLLPCLAVILPLSWLLPGDFIRWAIFFLWLFKPLFELSILNWASRALFGEKRKLWKTVKETIKQISFRKGAVILLCRLSPFRAFSMPVVVLEGLAGKERRQRLALLKDGSESVIFLTIACFCIEVLLTLSLMSILYWLVPENLRWVDFGTYIFRPDSYLYLFSYLICCSIMAPLYCSSGFMMYISRRVELEGWDIEIGFKRIQKRLQDRKNGVVVTTVAALLLCCQLLSFNSSALASVHPDSQEAKTTIEEVLTGNEFGKTELVSRWVPIEKEQTEIDNSWLKAFESLIEAIGELVGFIGPILASWGEVFLWLVLGVVIAFLVLKYSSIRSWLGSKMQTSSRQQDTPAVMFGMDLRPDSIPGDLEQACSALLDKGQYRDALGLLYRGTLSAFIHRFKLPIYTSYTEMECCKRVEQYRPVEESLFFSALTTLWIEIAYGHRLADEEKCRTIVSQWSEHYGEGA